MADQFADRQSGLDSPAFDGQPVVTNTPFAQTARALWIGVSGDVSLVTAGGTTLVFKSVPVGWLQVRCSQVTTANTTATNMIAVW